MIAFTCSLPEDQYVKPPTHGPTSQPTASFQVQEATGITPVPGLQFKHPFRLSTPAGNRKTNTTDPPHTLNNTTFSPNCTQSMDTVPNPGVRFRLTLPPKTEPYPNQQTPQQTHPTPQLPCASNLGTPTSNFFGRATASASLRFHHHQSQNS